MLFTLYNNKNFNKPGGYFTVRNKVLLLPAPSLAQTHTHTYISAQIYTHTRTYPHYLPIST